MQLASVPEDEWVTISSLQHYVYCPRQCALIHVEQVFDDNVFTLRGRRAHRRVDLQGPECVGDVRIERALPIWSERLGLIGKADCVEFSDGGRPYPVEYKVGPRKARRADEVQLCAQAVCLEEMLGVDVPYGAIYHHRSRRRREVVLDSALRHEMETVAAEVRQMILDGAVPPPPADERCPRCSLINACLPYAVIGSTEGGGDGL